MRPTDYLAQLGTKLVDSGYDVVPIAPGKKFPLLRGWQSVPVDHRTVEGWLDKGCLVERRDGSTYLRDASHDGVGIRTARTPAIDIDITHAALADKMEAWCHAHFGFAPVRVGRAPKRLLVFATKAVFPKQASVWLDDAGKEQRLEVLADGQQFVAHAIHPDTGKPYTWSADDLLTTPHADLPLLTRLGAEAALCAFNALAEAAGWTRKEGALVPLDGGGDDDMWTTVQPGVEIEDDELHDLLMAIPDFDTYETWVHVGMALHHHYEGGDEGLTAWQEWSEQSDKFDGERLDAKWASFKTRGDRPTKTARYIIALGREAVRKLSASTIRGLKERLLTAGSLDDLRAAAADGATTEMDILDRESLCGALKGAWKRLEGSALPTATARTMLRYRLPEAKQEMPAWMAHWVYLTHDDTFYNKETGEEVTRIGFDAKYDRRMLTAAERESGKASVETHASTAALNAWTIKTVVNRLYLPGEADEFILNGLAYVNSYRDTLVPLVPEKLRERDRRNIGIVEGHLANLFPDQRERGLLVSWLAYIVQTGGRSNWAVLIQGTEADGKSFFTDLMGALLGGNNVKTINPKTLESTFNGWSEGAQLAIVEEVKLQGHNKHDILNSIKMLITNPTIEVHRKGRDPYQAPNTQNYLLLSNYADALPLGEGDTRYFVLNSRFQNKLALDRFKADHPTYYRDLFNAVSESAGALRGWLLGYQLHEDFNPKDRAPWSRGRDYMAQMSASVESEAITTTLAETSRLDVRTALLDQESLVAEVEEITGELLSAWKIKRILADLGWTFLGRFSVACRMRRLWSQSPQDYQTDGRLDRAKLQSRIEAFDL